MTFKQLAAHKRRAKTLKKVRRELANAEGIELSKERWAIVNAIHAYDDELAQWEEYKKGKGFV